MSELWAKSRWIVISATLIAAGAFALSMLGPDPLPTDPLALTPTGTSILARIDVRTVTRSHVWNALLAADEDEQGVRRIERTCGYDPLEEVEEAVVFALGEEERPFSHLGFVARGEMARGGENRRRLVQCVRQVVGGSGMREERIEGERALASSSRRSYAAFLGSDGVVAGDRSVVSRVIRIVHGDARAANDAELRRLYQRLSPDRDAVAVGRLPARWLPAVRRFAQDLEGDLDALSAVRALGVGVGVRGGLSIAVAAVTDRASDAERLERAIDEQTDALLRDPRVRLSAIGRALRRLDVHADGREVAISLSLSNAQVDDLLELWRELRGRLMAEPPAVPEPDERVERTEGAPTEGAPTEGAQEEERPVPPAEEEPAEERAPAEEAREEPAQAPP